MLVPISWLKDYVEIPADMPVESLAERLTLAGLEVGKIQYIGVPQTQVDGLTVPPSDHLVWDRDKLVLGKIVEVKAHPDADRLVIAVVDYGGDELEECVGWIANESWYLGVTQDEAKAIALSCANTLGDAEPKPLSNRAMLEWPISARRVVMEQQCQLGDLKFEVERLRSERGGAG